jgi:hypothetical protein
MIYGGNLSRVTKVKRGYYEAEFEVLRILSEYQIMRLQICF